MAEKLIPTTYIVLRPGKPLENGSVDWPADPGYDRIRTLVEPIVEGHLERVRVRRHKAPGGVSDMFVNETGHLMTPPLALNEVATVIYQAFSVERGEKPDTLPFIVGNAIIFDRPVWF